MAEVTSLTPEELKKKIDRGDDFLLLDVRDAAETDLCRLPGALNIPAGRLLQEMSKLKEATEIVVYCKYGTASERAARLMKSAGIKYVRVLTGGIDGWAQRVDRKMKRY